MKTNPNLLLVSGILFAGTAAAFSVSYVAAPNDIFAPCRDNDMVDFAQIGGAFDLTHETGDIVSSSDLINRPTLLYMGYTFCPDVCPLDNMRNAEAIYALENRGLDAQAVFVSVDPERDNPEVLADFTDLFHPEMIGLTSDKKTMKVMAASYHAVFEFQDREDEYYLIDHTTFTYVVFPTYGVVDIVSRSDTADEVADRMQCLARQIETTLS